MSRVFDLHVERFRIGAATAQHLEIFHVGEFWFHAEIHGTAKNERTNHQVVYFGVEQNQDQSSLAFKITKIPRVVEFLLF